MPMARARCRHRALLSARARTHTGTARRSGAPVGEGAAEQSKVWPRRLLLRIEVKRPAEPALGRRRACRPVARPGRLGLRGAAVSGREEA